MSVARDKSTMLDRPIFRTFSSEERTQKLKVACEWLGIERGRAIEYVRLLDEFQRLDIFSDQHLLAFFESYELIELFDLWESRSKFFSDLKQKIADVYAKGPVLSDDEKTGSSSNRPRNNSYCYVVAGRFMAAGFDVLAVDGISLRGNACNSKSDFLFESDGEIYAVECKRLQSENQLLRRMKQARRQVVASGYRGIIGLDCSALFRPKGTVFQNTASRNAGNVASVWLEQTIEPEIRPSLAPEVLGFLISCRIPTMTPIRIVDKNGNQINRRDTATSWLGVGNPRNLNWKLLERIISRLEQQETGNPAVPSTQ